LFQATNNWQINIDHAIDTDHQLISTHFYDLEAPYIGKGRWELPLFLLDHKEFLDKLNEICEKAIQETENEPNNHPTHPQEVFTNMKKQIIKAAKTISREAVPKAKKLIKIKNKELTETLNNNNIDDVQKAIKAQTIEEEIKQLETNRHDQVRLNLNTKYLIENETISKTWIQANKEKKPRDIILGLRDPSNPTNPLVTKTKDMSNIAREYHNNLQSNGLPDPTTRTNASTEVLRNVKARIQTEDKEKLEQCLDEEEIKAALYSMPNGKASGLDGIPVELWKLLARNFDAFSKSNGPRDESPPDIIKLLCNVFNNIETNGTSINSCFAEGWMCPIYKKKDKADIANYRPITVLNADYKTFTKALSIKLAPIALRIIHPNQAGFMKGRQIDDHTELIKLIIEWCEAEKEDGLLVFLDQEKAYNKISHEFLDESLQTFGFPEHFRNTIKHLYSNAQTRVMINGVMSSERPLQHHTRS
jgi:hypothetical protein